MTTIAHYNLLDRIGEGGLGEVYRARDTKVGRTVALKVVGEAIAGDPAARAQLQERAAAASALSHPNIATLFDVGEADGRFYLAYEFVAGRMLREEMAGAAINPRRALDLAVQMADGVAEAHAHGIVHGDLRPDTIMVTAKGSAKVLDFGLAAWTHGGALRAQAARDPDGLPASAASVLAYLSPEQAIGGAVDPRTDVFSLGVITYEMLTGRNPFAAAEASTAVMNVIQAKVPPASQTNADVPVEVDETLARALTRDIESRQQSAAALSAELRSVAAVLDVRAGDTVEPAVLVAQDVRPGESTVLMPLDESPDRAATTLLAGALAAGAAAAAIVWWWLSHH